VKHAPAWLSTATASKIIAWLVILGVLLVIILLARAVGRLSKAASAPAPAAPKPSGGGGRLLLLGLLGAGGWVWYEARHKAAAAAGKAAPAPVPSPRPTVTTTVTPHPVTHFVMPHLSGGVVIGIFVIGAVVAIVLLGPLLRRSS
jgi:hypothetical protein